MGILTNNEIAENIFSLIKNTNQKGLVEIIEKVVFLDRQRLAGQTKIILSSIKDILYKQNKILEVDLISAILLENSQKEKLSLILKNSFDANEIIFNEKIDKDVLGGFKIEVKDEVIDLTLRKKILKLQEHLINKI